MHLFLACHGWYGVGMVLASPSTINNRQIIAFRAVLGQAPDLVSLMDGLVNYHICFRRVLLTRASPSGSNNG